MAIAVAATVGNKATTGSTVALNGLTGVSVGDLIVVCAGAFTNISSISGYGVTTWSKPNPPNQAFAADANHNDGDIWWGVVDGTPSNNGTVTFASASSWMGAVALRVTGAQQAVDVAVVFANDASATTDTKTITTTVDGDLIVSVMSFFNNVSIAATVPTGYTAVTAQTTTNSMMQVAYLVQATHGASSMNWSGLNNTGSNFPAVAGIAIKAAGGGATQVTGVGALASATAFGVPKLIRLIGPAGVAAGETWGRPTIIGGIQGPYTVSGVGAIASLEAFGVPKVIRLLGPVGIDATSDGYVLLLLINNDGDVGFPAVQFITAPVGIVSGAALGGTDKIVRLLGPAGVASANVFGTQKLLRILAPVGTLSGEAFGRLSIIGGVPPLPQVAGAGAIASLEAFGVASIRRLLAAVGAATGETFGTTRPTRILAPTGLGSAGGFGAPASRRILAPAGLASVEAFGVARPTRILVAVGVQTGQAFGMPLLGTFIAPNVSIAGTAAIADFQPITVLVGDQDTWIIGLADLAEITTVISDWPGG
jgi:hypothetical protein